MRPMIIALVAALAAGCKDKEGTGPDVDDTDADADADADTDTDVDTDTDTDTDGDTDTDTDDPCWVESDLGRCWDCPLPNAPGADSLQALNQCSTLSAVPFDNAARIPASTWVPGDPLPAVP